MICIESEDKGVGKQGFLILEVLLVVMIMSTSLIVVIHSMMTSARSSVKNEQYFRAALERENRRFQDLNGKERKK